jgi:hypothetical protein
VLSVLLRYTDSDYPFGIFKLFSPNLTMSATIVVLYEAGTDYPSRGFTLFGGVDITHLLRVFFVLLVFVLCPVPYVTNVSRLSIREFSFRFLLRLSMIMITSGSYQESEIKIKDRVCKSY